MLVLRSVKNVNYFWWRRKDGRRKPDSMMHVARALPGE